MVLFSHPADFTPVCTAEFVAFSAIHDDLKALNVQLLGLSVDNVSSHLGWVRAIKEKLGVSVPFPIIADLSMKIAKKYGMIQPGMSSIDAVRSAFFIDDKGIMRAMIYYPLTNGRYMPEIVRLVKALQATDNYKVSTPANWQPGDKVAVPPPKTVAEMEKQEKKGYDYKDGYLCYRDIK